MWLVKTEPAAYGWAELEKEGGTRWDGVTNPAALRNLRAMQAGDRVVIYHTGNERAAVGLAEVTRAAYPDPKRGNPRLVVVDLKPVAPFARHVTLAEIKALAVFADSPLVRQGRLSVVPLTAAQWKALEARSRE
jgi:predicted RNA-binding protein with PUA-like domain